MRKLLASIFQKLGIFHFLVRIATDFQRRRLAKCFRAHGLETLLRANEAVKSANARMFLAYGTLLGAFREKNFIPYDFDLDVGMFANERPEDFEKIMAQYGFSRKRTFYIKETGQITEDQYEYKGVQIDFFYQFEKDENTLYSYICRQHESKDWRTANQTDGFPCITWEYENSDLVTIDFLGHELYIPEKTESWLRTIYGDDFMTPIRNKSAANRPISKIRNERLYRK